MRAVRMHADEADIDESLVRRLVAAQFPQWAHLPVEWVDSAGTENAMYRLGEGMAVRLPRTEGAVDGVERELRWLLPLAARLPVAVPAPLGVGVPGEGFPWDWSVYRWLDGKNPVVGDVAEPDRLAEDLAEFITALRGIDPAGAPPSSRGVPLADRDAPTRAAIEALRDLAAVGTGTGTDAGPAADADTDLAGLRDVTDTDTAIDIDAVTAAWADVLRIPERSGPATWSHGDLSPGNILVSDGRLNAVIDFGVVGVGDPTVDLIVAWNLLPADARPVFREALRVDDATWARGRGWALSISLIQLPYYRATNPVLAANSRHVIREVLTDLRDG